MIGLGLGFQQGKKSSGSTGGSDTTPDAYDFTDETGVNISTSETSDIVQITGIDAAATVSVTGGEFRICSDGACSTEVQTWGSSNQSISNNQYIQLRVTSSASYSTATEVDVTIGGVAADWSVTTKAFTPAEISDLGAWYDASDTASITESAGAVSQWNDKSGNGNHATQGTAANKPTTGTRTVNSLNVLDFDGSADFLAIPSGIHNISAGPNTVMVVMAKDSVALGARSVIGGNGVFSIGTNLASNQTTHRNHASTILTLTITPNTSPTIIGQVRSGTSLTGFAYGARSTGGTSAQDITTTAATIGASSTGASNYHDGIFAEIIMYRKALSTTEQNLVGNYLESKWGVNWSDV